MKIFAIKFERIWMDFLVDEKPESIIFSISNIESDNITTSQIIPCDNLNIIESSNEKYILRFNITCINKRNFLPYGIWSIYKNEVKKENLIEVSNDAIDDIFNLAKIYYFDANWQSYNISFKFLFDGDRPYLQLMSAFSKTDKGFKRTYKLKTRIKKIIYKTANRLYCILSSFTKKDLVLFFSDTYANLTPQLQVVLDAYNSKNNKILQAKSISFVLANNMKSSIGKILKTLFWVAKAKYLIIDNYSFTLNQLDISKSTKLIQLWHANEGFKSVGYSRFGMEGSPSKNVRVYKSTYRALAPSKAQIPIYEEVFGIERSAFLPWGRPEISDLGDPNKSILVENEFYTKFPVLKNKEIILFAPTYRGKNHKSGFYYNFNWLDITKIYNSLQDGQVFVIKLHGYIRNVEDLVLPKDYQDKIMLLPSETNINDLYLITDILITDYSSAYSDFAFLKKPILFFTPDRLEYQYIRGVNNIVANYAPGKICDTLDSLLEALQNRNFNLSKTVEYSNSIYLDYTGNTANKLVDWIIEDTNIQ